MEEQPQLSLEEIRERNLKFYEEQIPYLTKTLEYEEVLAHIEEARLRKVEAMIRLASLLHEGENKEPKVD